MLLFDRPAVRRNRDRAAPVFTDHDFLVQEVAQRLADRLDDLARPVFPLALDLGCHDGPLGRLLGHRVGRMIQCDLSPALAARAAASGHPTLVADEEWLPFAPASFDLVMSGLSLGLVNDLPGTLAQIRRVLRPGGLFLAALPAAGTLDELRHSLIAADTAGDGAVAPRIAPFADIKTLGALLPRAGFIDAVADADTLTIRYGDPLRLLADLRGAGAANTLAERRRTFSRRATMIAALDGYRRDFGQADGRCPATVVLVTLTGWVPPA